MVKKWMITHSSSIAACFFLISCGDEETSEVEELKPITSAFLVAADFTPANVADIEAYELYEELQEADFLYTNKPESSSAADDKSDACIEEKLGKIKAKASGDTVTLGAHVDMASCFTSDDSGISIDGANFKFFFQLVCPGEDLSVLEGTSLSDDVLVEFDCKAGTILRNMGGTIAVSGSSDDSTFAASSTLASYEGNSPTAGCEYSQAADIITQNDGCKAVDLLEPTRLVFDGVETELEGADITDFTASGVTYVDNETAVWRTSGTINGRVNNWNGNVVFGGDAVNPSYTFTSSTGETQDSTIAPTSGAGLHMTQAFASSLQSFQQSVQRTRPACQTTRAYCRYR